jgi:serine/threonine protein phosphatase PrpC
MISAFGSTNIGGTSNKENQDSYFIGDHMFGVFDGHGRGGRSVALTTCTVFAEASLDSSFPEIFAAAEKAVSLIKLPIAPSAGGTTASCLYIDPDEGYCQVGHVGDSEVRYFDDDDGAGVSLTADHSACSLEEFLRIKVTPDPSRFEFSPRPPSRTGRPVFVKQGDDWIMDPRGGNSHCTVRGDWGAYLVSPYDDRLAVTRALGDFHMKPHGVIAEPTVTTVDPPAAGVTRAIVLASDGLWDAMKYEEVRAIVRKPELLGNAEAATGALMEAALAKNAAIFGASTDNVTAVVVYTTTPDTLCDTPPADLSLASPLEREICYNGDDEEECTQGWREGICKCCGSCTTFQD